MAKGKDAAFGIIGGLQPPEQQLTHWKTYGALEIYMPPPEFILAVKIFGYRDRDYNDVAALIKELHVQTRAGTKDCRHIYTKRGTKRI